MPDAPPSRARLTDELAHRLPLATDPPRYLVRDDQLPGFFLRVTRTRKAYAIEVTVRRGGRRNVSKLIGYVGDVSAREARQQAKRAIGELQTRPEAGGRGPTLRAAWEMYAATLERRGRSAKTIRGYRDSIVGHLSDWLDRPLGRIAPEDVVTRHAEITKSSGPYAANRMIAALRAVYRAARKIRRELPPPPTDAVAANTETRRKRALDARGLAAWRAQLDALPNPVRREFHWLLLLTGGRPAALSRARWKHVDPRRRAWHFPDPKGGTARAFDIPLSRPMVAALRRLRKGEAADLYGASEWIFPGDAGHLVDTTEPRERLSHWGGDLRRTFKTLGLAVGLTELDTMILQNHALAGASRGYIVTPALWAHLTAQQARLSRYIAERARRMQS